MVMKTMSNLLAIGIHIPILLLCILLLLLYHSDTLFKYLLVEEDDKIADNDPFFAQV